MKIFKRDGSEVEFDGSKIYNAMLKAYNEVHADEDISDKLEQVDKDFRLIVDNIKATCHNKQEILKEEVSVEGIQDMVEEQLMNTGYTKVAKAYILYRDRRNQERSKEWDMTELQRDIYNKKYRWNGESFNEFLDRVSGGNGSVKSLMRNKRFLPAGRILSGRGTNEEVGRRVSFSNCFVINSPEDSINDIFEIAKLSAEIYKTGGGVGFNLKNLRPRGSKVNNVAEESSGAVSFMPLYDVTTATIAQKSRAGALLLTLPIWHPDAEEFIDVKTNTDKITKANISVWMTDDFMQSVKDKELSYTQRFNIIERDETIEKRVDPLKLYRKLCMNAKDWAEPGILFGDTINNYHINDHTPGYEYEATNPCQPKGEYILTADGFRKIEDLTDNIVLNGEKYNSTQMFYTGDKEVFEVTLENNAKIKMTSNHLITNDKGIDEPLSDYTVGDKVQVDYNPIHDTKINEISKYELGILAGWMVADGTVSKYKNGKPFISYVVGQNEFEYAEVLESYINKYITDGFKFKPHNQKPETCLENKIHRKNDTENFLKTIGVNNYDKFSIDLYNKSKDFKLGYLRAIFTCDGSSSVEGIATLYSINQTWLRDIQRILMEFGIYATVTIHNYAKKYVSKDGKTRNNKDTWKIAIYDTAFKDIGFLTKSKQEKLMLCKTKNSKVITNKKKNLKIKSIESVGVMPVYDITVDKIHHYNTNGLVVHNCGEKALLPGASCLLGSFNLSEYVLNPFTNEAEFDFERFKQDVREVVVYMDDVLEEGIEYLPLEINKEQSINYRQLGIGVMGWGDTLIKMKMIYGKEESLEFADRLFSVMANEALQQSALLAKARGTYPKYEKNYVLQSNYLKNVATDETMEMIREYGLRNSELLSIAPTGTISSLISTSGGAEPVFQLRYNRRTITLHDEETIYEVEADIVKQYRDITGDTDELPEYFVTAYDIPYRERIGMQSVIQKYIDSSISSTVNLPKGTTVEEVEDLYMYAWEKNLKGITIYVDGSRDGILTTADDNKEEVKQKDVCPECGGKLEYTNGCRVCSECQYGMCEL